MVLVVVVVLVVVLVVVVVVGGGGCCSSCGNSAVGIGIVVLVVDFCRCHGLSVIGLYICPRFKYLHASRYIPWSNLLLMNFVLTETSGCQELYTLEQLIADEFRADGVQQ